MKQFIKKITLKKIIIFFALFIFSIIIFYRYKIINGVDNFQLFQIYLRLFDMKLYQEDGFLFGPGTNFFFIIFSKLNAFNI